MYQKEDSYSILLYLLYLFIIYLYFLHFFGIDRRIRIAPLSYMPCFKREKI